MISDEVENSSEPIAPRLSWSTDKSMVNTRNRANCDKKVDLHYFQSVFEGLRKLNVDGLPEILLHYVLVFLSKPYCV